MDALESGKNKHIISGEWDIACDSEEIEFRTGWISVKIDKKRNEEKMCKILREMIEEMEDYKTY